jgi:hypothetical protein
MNLKTPALLHSLFEFRELFNLLLSNPHIRFVCEIGSEFGGFSRLLLNLLSERKLERVTIIEPFPAADLESAVQDSGGKGVLLAQLSLEALDGLEPHDLYFVDGDHNFYTVRRELDLIFSANPSAIVVLHDVCWPSARRDTYYNPDNIPQSERQAFGTEVSIVIGNPGTAPTGFTALGNFGIALKEGGEKNGVLSAVEDFVEQSGEFKLDIVPVVFGVGILRRVSHPLEELICEILPSPQYSALLARLELNRLENWLDIVSLQSLRCVSPKSKGWIGRLMGKFISR